MYSCFTLISANKSVVETNRLLVPECNGKIFVRYQSRIVQTFALLFTDCTKDLKNWYHNTLTIWYQFVGDKKGKNKTHQIQTVAQAGFR